MNARSPRISVVMPVRDGSAYVGGAIESILDQTFRDFEFLIIDDYSRDDVFASLASYARADDRIRLLRNEGEPGISAALNTALRQTRGEYVARQDSDDVSLPARLARQLAFLENNPSIAVVGSFIWVNAAGKEQMQLHREPVGPTAVLFHSQVGTPFAHPTVMWRNASFREAGLVYAEVAAQDFDLWARAFAAGVRGDNIADALLVYRLHDQSDSNRRHDANLKSADAIARARIHALTGHPAEEKFCTPRFRAVVHAILTGNPIALSLGDRVHLANAAELLRRDRANGSFGMREQGSIEAHIVSAYRQCSAEGPPVSAGPAVIGSASDSGIEAAASWYSSVADHLRRQKDVPRHPISAADAAHRVPVYVPSFNNPTYLKMMIDQLIAHGLHNIIIIDGGSTFPTMLSYFRNLPNEVSLIRLTKNKGPRHLFQDAEGYSLLPDHFCLTDPDLRFNPQLAANFLTELIEITERYHVGKAGFSLDISDRDAMFQERFVFGASKAKIWEWEEQFWQKPLSQTSGGDQIYRASIDTTFAVYNKKYFDPSSHLDAVRVAGRYTCRHLPWYRDQRLPPDEAAYYRQTAQFSFFAGDTVPSGQVTEISVAGLTPSRDGFARIIGTNGSGLFVVSATNTGVPARVRARVRLSDPTMPLTATICETDPATGRCKQPPVATIERAMRTNETTTWSVFLRAAGAIADDRFRNRVIFEFIDADDIPRGAASTAVMTE